MNKASSTFKSRQISFIIQCGLFTSTVFCIHQYLLHYFASKTIFFFPVWHIYLFNFVLTTMFFTIINYKYSRDKSSVFNTFILSTLVKMVLAILFLLPVLIGESKDKKLDIFNFFITYFLFLTLEVYSITKFLQNDDLKSL